MISRLITACLENRFLTITIFVVLAAAGIWAAVTLPVDALPDLTDVQVILLAEWPGQSPQVIEDQITFPLTSALQQVGGVKTVRSMSYFGVSFVFAIFEDGTDMAWARSRVTEYLNTIEVPEGASVKLGPEATGLGWVYMYTLEDPTGNLDLGELRALQDGYVRPLLQSVDGVAEIASVGGAPRRYEIVVDPERLWTLGIDVPQIADALRRANRDVGGQSVEISEHEYMVRAFGYLRSIEDIEKTVLRMEKGTPLLVRDVAEVMIAPSSVRGFADLNGEGETVCGIVVMRYGENAREVIARVRERIDDVVLPGLPEGVTVRTVYDRAPLIGRAMDTLRIAFTQELVIIAIVCVLFLFHLRSAFVAFVTLPLGALLAFIVMRLTGLNANIMSLAGIAIAFGTMVDASIVMVENVHKHLERGETTDRFALVRQACREVGPGLFFSLLVVVLSNLPIFALEDVSGRLFKPMAWTNTFAMAAACAISVTLIPPLVWFFVRGRIRPESRNPLSRFIIALYAPVVRFVVRRRKTVLITALVLVVAALGPFRQLGTEHMPPLEEGDLLFMPTSVPGLAPAEARRALQTQDALFVTFPEIKSVLGKIGRSTSATDPAPLMMVETTAMLHKESTWPRRLIRRGWIGEYLTGYLGADAGAVENMSRTDLEDRIRTALIRAQRETRPDLWEDVRVSVERKTLETLPFEAWMEEILVHRSEEYLRSKGTAINPDNLRNWIRGHPPGPPPLEQSTFDRLTGEEMQRVFHQPGMPNWFLMPIQTRIGMVTTGMKGDLGLKIFGTDYKGLEAFAVEVERILQEMPSTVSAVADRVATGGYYLDARIDREAAARYGLNVDDIQKVVTTAIGGMPVTETVEGRYRFPVVVRYPRERRQDPETLSRVLIRTRATGSPAVVPLGSVVDFHTVRGPAVIKSEDNLLVTYLPVVFDGISLGEYVERAQATIDRAIGEGQLVIPPGFTMEWSGQYEIQRETNRRLLLIVPGTIVAIFLVLFMYFRRLSNTLIVLGGTLLFAPVGAIWLTHLLGYNISTAWWLGMILLLGLAAETGVIMLVYLDNAVKERIRKHGTLTPALLEEAIEEGAIRRVRPKVMTVVTDALGIAPLLFATGAGAMTLQRMAAPLVGGIVSSMILTLCIIPAAYRMIKGYRL